MPQSKVGISATATAAAQGATAAAHVRADAHTQGGSAAQDFTVPEAADWRCRHTGARPWRLVRVLAPHLPRPRSMYTQDSTAAQTYA